MDTSVDSVAYIEQDEYKGLYYESQRQQRLFHLPYREFERLAANKLRSDLASNIPQVNDGSLAAILRETPMRVLARQQSGVFTVTSAIDPQTGEPGAKAEWLDDFINVAWDNELVPLMNTQAPFLNKQQLSLYKATIYGSVPIYDFLTERNGKKCVDFVILDPRDVYLERGKSSDLDSDYIFMDTWYTPLQLRKVIAQARADGANSSWDVSALQKLYDSKKVRTKDYLQKNQAERNRPVMAEYYKVTTIFQRGVGAPIDTFDPDNGTLYRHRTNDDPAGDIGIHYLYAFEDLVNPYGVGQVEMSGGTQNVLDYLTQLHVLAYQIGLQPPILVEGDRSMTDLDSMIYSPSQFWFTGGAKVDIMETSSNIVTNFPNAYNLYKSQLTNMQQQSTIDIPSTAGDPINGKTPQAINQSQQREGSHDNYYRKQVAQTYGLVFRHMMNTYIANMTDEDTIRVFGEMADKLLALGMPGNKIDGGAEFVIEWNNIRGTVNLTIDPDSSKESNDQRNVEVLSTVLTNLDQNPHVEQSINENGYSLNVGQLYIELLSDMGIGNLNKILQPLSAEEKDKLANSPSPLVARSKIDLKYSDLPPKAQVQALLKGGFKDITEMDVLMGPVPNPNIRGVFAPRVPEDQDQIYLPNKASVQPNPAFKGSDIAAQVVAKAREMGLPENEIQSWLINNNSQLQPAGSVAQ